MPPFSIQVSNLAKRYRINKSQNSRFRYRSLREEFMSAVTSPLRAMRDGAALGNVEEFWALRDVDFKIEPGETVGVIGRNGAGKSTLLKILSRITSPTTGRVELRGRVGSLLEVGTGFHPELSGRDNIFLNGAILGMTRHDIRRQFDDIVQFAEVEKFLDTPVKRYSSGMYVRLAFAVAAHLEPEILVVDEVLAVGDASFQKKCLNKMEHVGKSGRTVLFVSHNMPSVTRLCDRTILLDEGKIQADGLSHEVVTSYLRSGLGTTSERAWSQSDGRPGNHIAQLERARVINADGNAREAMEISEPVGVEIEFEVLEPGHVLVPNFALTNADGTCVFSARDVSHEWRGRQRTPGKHIATAWIPGHLLTEGAHIVSVCVSTMNPVVVHFHERDALAFEIVEGADDKVSARGEFAGAIPGIVRPLLEWENRLATSEAESKT